MTSGSYATLRVTGLCILSPVEYKWQKSSLLCTCRDWASLLLTANMGSVFRMMGLSQAPKVPIEAELNGDTNNDQKSMHVAKHSHEPNGNFSFAKLDDYNRCPKSQKLKVGLVDMPLSATCIQQFATCHLHAISAV